MKATVLSEGLRGGAILGVLAVVLGVGGLSPSLTWIPEVPLLAAFVLLPAGIAIAIGYRAASHAGRFRAGVFAGVIAGSIGGCVGGLTYVAYGKPLLNVLLGVIAGVIGGGVAGGIGAMWTTLSKRTRN